MKKSVVLLFFALVFCAAAQTSIIIYEFTATGLDAATVSAFSQLFTSELTGLGYSCKDAPSGEMCTDAACAAAGAKAAGTQQALYGSLSKLGEKVIVSIYVADASGATVHTDKLTSTSVEDLDVVIGRLARGMAEGKKAEEVLDKTNVTDAETAEPRRRKNYYTIGARIGYRFPLGDSYGKEQMWQYEAVAMYELEKLFIEGRGYGCSGGDAYSWGLTVGAYYIFSPKDIAPYVGGAAGIEWAEIPFRFEGDDTWTSTFDDGPTVSVSGGLLAFQTYDFRLMLDLRYQAVFMGKAEEEIFDWELYEYITREKDLGVQHSIAITLGITRKDIGGDRGGGLCCMPW